LTVDTFVVMNKDNDNDNDDDDDDDDDGKRDFNMVFFHYYFGYSNNVLCQNNQLLLL